MINTNINTELFTELISPTVPPADRRHQRHGNKKTLINLKI